MKSIEDFRGGPVLLPVGLHAADEIFGPICDHLGFARRSYPLDLLKLNPDGTYGQGLLDLLKERIALFVVPTFFKLNEGSARLSEGVFAYGSVSTGTDHVDLEVANRHEIHFIHSPGANSAAVAEYLLASLPLLFDAERLARRDVRIGIVGYGRIGGLLGGYLDYYGFPFRFYDPFVAGRHRCNSIEELFDSDLVTFHVPLTITKNHATKNMITFEHAKFLKKDAALINTSRGEIMDGGVYRHICENHRCVMDVFPVEPPDDLMVRLAAYASPHVAGYDYRGRAGGTRLLAQNFVQLLGIDPSIVPHYAEPEYSIHTIDFLGHESAMLRRDPNSFRRRREHYPERSDFRSSLGRIDRGSLDEFQNELLEIPTPDEIAVRRADV
jgi:phosphoglycerate dehydrogenase-like enzyme